jgi:hypothetical protein
MPVSNKYINKTVSQSIQKSFTTKIWVANHRLRHSGLSRLQGLCVVLFNPYRGSFSEVKRPRREADHLPPSSAEARKTMYCNAPKNLCHLSDYSKVGTSVT